eukprot:CAMPEP_0117608500 /NCGR_PEP_ID=MMETSP0784-20121206/80840_1 /TAXON_ID=39447 /ORGANISM="" /LENGTH=416 /DNA_ID=CAMNT_0005411775 /DNA_START=1 /DNA_END=1248 /DNA_ORIENTATION=-
MAKSKKVDKSIGHYILGKTIGEGTFGKVKLGTHIATGEKVAVKILERERIKEVADVERVAREIHILKIIQHPHIIKLYEVIETPEQLFLIMEYCSGGELFGPSPGAERLPIFSPDRSALEQIHKINIVHRDLKPENLLLDEHRNIKIVDFGLSNMFKDGQLLKTACGSPCYAAPEMIAGHLYVPARCDVWSCGVIVFALICGFLPFEDQNTSALYRKILNAEYQTPRFISQQARSLINAMLTTDPVKRITLPEIRQHAWYLQIPNAASRWEGVTVSRQLELEVLNELEQIGLSRDHVRECLRTNKHNFATTAYYLLVERERRKADHLDSQMRELEQEQTQQETAAANIPDSEGFASDAAEADEKVKESRCANGWTPVAPSGSSGAARRRRRKSAAMAAASVIEEPQRPSRGRRRGG